MSPVGEHASALLAKTQDEEHTRIRAHIRCMVRKLILRRFGMFDDGPSNSEDATGPDDNAAAKDVGARGDGSSTPPSS